MKLLLKRRLPMMWTEQPDQICPESCLLNASLKRLRSCAGATQGPVNTADVSGLLGMN